MDILGVGSWELFFILIIALLVFGPKRLPEIAGKAGKLVRDLRGMSQGFMTEWQREIAVATRMEELQEVKQQLQETKESLRQVGANLASAPKQISQTATLAVKPLPSLPAPPMDPVVGEQNAPAASLTVASETVE